MRPGLWFEFEKTTYKVAEELGEDVILKRNGYVIAPNRPKLDLRNEKARKWLLSKIDNVYKMGVRYIKNDHNNDEFLGTNYEGENPAEGLRKKHEAFISFIKELYEKYPDLVIENCSAGGGRSEYGTLKYCSLQSITDQEDYKLMPSVISGCMAQLQPEKVGIWAYPYPLLFKDMATFVKPTSEIEECADGRETIFNMISGMCGYLYLSGRLDLADKTNTGLIKEAIKVYKTYRNDISGRYPVFPFGLKNMCETDENGYLKNVVEHTRIMRNESGKIISELENGDKVELNEGQLVSMNLWCFTPSILNELEGGFKAFLKEKLAENPLKCEYFLPSVVDRLIKEGKAETSVLTTDDKWYGVTYHEDKQLVMDAFKAMREKGLYPKKLWS